MEISNIKYPCLSGRQEKSKIQSKIRKFKFCNIILIFAFCILNFTGCAAVTECAKGIAGTSTRSLEKARKGAIIKTLPYDYFTSYTKILDTLKQTRVCVYAQDVKKYMIALYVSDEDTTPVGIFFKEIDKANTQIEISSPSTYAKEFIAAKLFTLLEGQDEK